MQLFFEGEAGHRQAVVALSVEGATLAPIIESAELYVKKQVRKAGDE
jgi:hypothetical protein